jgi:hypothetical protein
MSRGGLIPRVVPNRFAETGDINNDVRVGGFGEAGHASRVGALFVAWRLAMSSSSVNPRGAYT